MDEATEIKRLILMYEGASGQRINLDKIEITVSPNVPENIKEELRIILKVRAVDQHHKYLGLPTLIGKRKIQIFIGIVDRIQKKMKEWKEQSLSQAGREILIKMVLQAIPSYSMNCFMLPITTCQEIEKASARFFWGSTFEDRKMHWATWDILTTTKANGGIGFKEIYFFNIAMLCKTDMDPTSKSRLSYTQNCKSKIFPKA